MNGDQFYMKFKEALQELGYAWSDKHEMQVNIVDGKLVYSRKIKHSFEVKVNK